ncbi:hypothetical protein Tco_1318483, partial [Tanacetum coccineum]
MSTWNVAGESDKDDHDVIHDNNSSDLALSTSLNDLDFATLNIDGQSTDVEAPPYITDVDEDDDFIDDEDDVPRIGGRKATRGCKGGGRDGGSKGTRKETKNLVLKKVTDEYGLLKIRFEFNDKGTMLHLGENSTGWSNLIGELVREYSIRSKCSKLGKEQGLLASKDPVVLRDQQIKSSVTREYPSLIQTFFDTHTYGGELAQDEARVQY